MYTIFLRSFLRNYKLKTAQSLFEIVFLFKTTKKDSQKNFMLIINIEENRTSYWSFDILFSC